MRDIERDIDQDRGRKTETETETVEKDRGEKQSCREERQSRWKGNYNISVLVTSINSFLVDPLLQDVRLPSKGLTLSPVVAKPPS